MALQFSWDLIFSSLARVSPGLDDLADSDDDDDRAGQDGSLSPDPVPLFFF